MTHHAETVKEFLEAFIDVDWVVVTELYRNLHEVHGLLAAVVRLFRK